MTWTISGREIALQFSQGYLSIYGTSTQHESKPALDTAFDEIRKLSSKTLSWQATANRQSFRDVLRMSGWCGAFPEEKNLAHIRIWDGTKPSILMLVDNEIWPSFVDVVHTYLRSPHRVNYSLNAPFFGLRPDHAEPEQGIPHAGPFLSGEEYLIVNGEPVFWFHFS
jgi:hypothetical protein